MNFLGNKYLKSEGDQTKGRRIGIAIFAAIECVWGFIYSFSYAQKESEALVSTYNSKKCRKLILGVSLGVNKTDPVYYLYNFSSLYQFFLFRCWNFSRGSPSHIFIRSWLSIMLFIIPC